MIDFLLQNAYRQILPDIVGQIICFVWSWSILYYLTGNIKVNGNDKLFFQVNVRQNIPRIKLRYAAKCFSFAVNIYLINTNQEDKSLIPTFFQQFLYSLFYGFMGFIDDLEDDIKPMKIYQDKIPKIIIYFTYLIFLIPIPTLILSNSIYAYIAIHVTTVQIIGKKVDNKIFLSAVIIGVPLILSVIIQKGGVIESAIPLQGIFLLIFSHYLYETFDENQFTIKLIKMGFPSFIFEVVNQHFFVSFLVLFGFFDRNWLYLSTGAYPVAKIGLSIGAIGLKEVLD